MSDEQVVLTSEEYETYMAEILKTCQEDGPVTVRLHRAQALAVVAGLQLTLRHPTFQTGESEQTGARIREFCDQVIKAMSESTNGMRTYPMIQKALRAGYNAENDKAAQTAVNAPSRILVI